MGSTVISEVKVNGDRGPLSLSVDTPPSSSPFPSPSSSFLPPPMPGVHEFAVKPAPMGRNHKKSGSRSKKDEMDTPSTDTQSSKRKSEESQVLSPTTPTPAALQLLPDDSPAPKSLPSSTATTPTKLTNVLPKTPTTPSTPSFYAPGDSNPLTSNRPAPASPAISRRTSQAPSTSSARSKSSRSSRPNSVAISRANSTRKPTNRLSQLSTTSTHLTSSPKASTSVVNTLSLSGAAPRRHNAPIKIRDFGFDDDDERHQGLGSDVPKPNRPKTLNRHLRSTSMSSSASSDNEGEEEQDEEGDGWGGFKWGMGRFSWSFGNGATPEAGNTNGNANGEGSSSAFPSKNDLDRNFIDGEGDEEEDDYYDGEGGGEDGGEDTPLYPGLYRALYAFEPEGTAELALEEDQIVRVVGRGGGVGWAVVAVDNDKDPGAPGNALVPESYLELVQIEGEYESDDGA